MQLFSYTAKSDVGKTIKGKVEARNERHAVQVLRAKNLIVIKIHADKPAMSLTIPFFNRIKSDDLVQFTNQLSTMLNSGLPLTDALALLKSQSKPTMSSLLDEIAQDVQGGSSLTDALIKHPEVFSSVYVSLVRAGEASGKLDDILLRLAENEDKRREFKAKTKGAMVYPVIVLIAMVGVMVMMMMFVIPQLAEMYTSFDAELPFITQVLISMSDFMRSFWWLLAALILGGIFGYRNYYKTAIGRKQIDGALLKVPIFGSLREKTVLTEFTRTLALLVGAGVSILESLSIVASAMNNVIFQDAVNRAAKGVEKGMPLAAMLAKQQVFPVLMSQMVAVGEETGQMEQVLMKVSKYFESDVEHLIKNLTTAMEPAIMVLLGAMVAFIVLGVLTPLYKLTTLF